MDLKWLMLNENSQIQNATHYGIPFNDILENAQLIGTENISGFQGLELEGMVTTKGGLCVCMCWNCSIF